MEERLLIDAYWSLHGAIYEVSNTLMGRIKRVEWIDIIDDRTETFPGTDLVFPGTLGLEPQCS